VWWLLIRLLSIFVYPARFSAVIQGCVGIGVNDSEFLEQDYADCSFAWPIERDEFHSDWQQNTKICKKFSCIYMDVVSSMRQNEATVSSFFLPGYMFIILTSVHR